MGSKPTSKISRDVPKRNLKNNGFSLEVQTRNAVHPVC
jgi:hypothetical protein